MRWLPTAIFTAVLAACGGGGGGDEPAPTTPVNQAPTAAIAAPAANATFAAGETIHITATAADGDGTVAKVEFFADGTKIGEDTTAPFAYDWVNPPTGAHVLTVRATDNAGAVTLSAERSVGALANQLPTVSVSAPANSFKANAGATVLLSANAADADGSITKVEFFKIDPAAPVYDSTTLVGVATAVGTPPSFQLTTAALDAGVYNFVARATDSQGGTAASGSVQVIINALPSIALTSPAPGANVVPGTNLTLRATATDADGSITKVEFFLDGSTTPLGVGTKNGDEYTLTWTTTIQGAYAFTARATDNDGATQTTGSVAVNVPANVLPTVTLDNPAAGTNVPTTLNLSASASDGDGSVTGVEFAYTIGGVTTKANGTLAAGKWTLAVPIGAAQFGTYAVTATVTDNLGGKTTSPSKNVTVAANVPPAVNITSSAAVTQPVGNAQSATTVALAATASDSDGITKVEFFNGAVKIGDGTLSAGSYQLAWTNVAAGSYTITAKATDTVGSVETSTAQTLVVTPNLAGPWASLNAAQKAGITLTPNRSLGDPGVDAGAVMTAIGVNTVAPKYVSAMSQGLRKLADLPLAVTGTTMGEAADCPQGGKIAVFDLGGGERAIDLINCKIDGFNFFGGGDFPLQQPYTSTAADNQCTSNGSLPPSVPPAPPRICEWQSQINYKQLSANSFRIFVKAVQASGNGTPEALSEPFPHNAYGFGFVQCTVTNGVKRCVTSHENSFVWGEDLAWTNWGDNGTTAITTPLNLYATDDKYTLSGTLRPCQADPQPENATPEYCQATPPAAFHIKFDAMTVDGLGAGTASGRAIVYADNGWSIVTRLAHESPGVERMTVQQTLTVGGQQPLRSYRCSVDSNGFYVCAEAP